MESEAYDMPTQPVSDGSARRSADSHPWPRLDQTIPGSVPVGPAAVGRARSTRTSRHAALPGGCLGAALLVALGIVAGIVVALVWMAFASPRVAPVPIGAAPGGATVTVDDAFLSAAIRTALAGAQLPITITNARAQCLAGDRINITGTAGIGPLAAPLTITAQPVAVDGRLAMRVLSASVGAAPLPTDADAAIESAIDTQIAATVGRVLPDTGYVVRAARTTPGHLIVVVGPRG